MRKALLCAAVFAVTALLVATGGSARASTGSAATSSMMYSGDEYLYVIMGADYPWQRYVYDYPFRP